MARTKTTVARSRQQGHSRSTPTKNTRSQKRKNRDSSPDTPKRKKLNQEEPIEVSDSDESDDFIPDQNFHHGTTWPLDASLEVQVTYEGVKEVRSIKQQFFPLLFHLTRGEPENIAKAIAAIKPVYKILSDRFEKESKPLDNRSTNIQALKSKAESSKPVVSSSKSAESSSKPAVSRAEILKKLPHHHFRDAEGKWLPKKQWKIAEILKDNTKVQSILSGEPSQISGTEKITELGYAKSAIRNILSRVSLKRPLYVNLFMWMNKLDMNSFENPQLPRKREKQKAKKKTEKKVEKKKEVKKNLSNSSKMILYGMEESAIIPDKRLRSKPKFMPFIRPNQKTSKTDGKTQSLLKKRTTSYTPYSAAMKNYVQKSGSYAQKSRFSGSNKEQSGSSRGFSVLFKGRTFSSGKKIFYNRNQSFQSGSDSESESDSSSTSSSLAQDGGMTASRSLEPQQTGSKTKVCSSAGRNAKRKSPRTISQSNLSCKSEKYVLYSDVNSSEDDAEDNPPVVKSPTVRLPRIDIRRLSDSVVKSLSSPKKDKQHEMPEVRGSIDSSSKNLENVESASSYPSPQDDMLGIRITDVKSLTDQEERLFDNKEMETDDKTQNMNEGQGNSEKKSDEAETGNVSKGASEVNNTTASKKVVHVVLEEEQLQLPDIEVNEREIDGMETSLKEAGMDKSSGVVEPSRNKGNNSQESPSVVHWENAKSGSHSSRQIQGKGVRGQEKGPSPDSTDVQNVKHNDIATASTQSDKPTGSTSSSSSTTTNTQETLRSLINQLTSLTSDSLDCKIIFSNSNQVLTIGEGRKGSVRERSMDIKPNVDQINLQGNPQILDSNNGTSSHCGSSKQGNYSGTGNPCFDGDVRGENPSVPNVQVKEERQWVGLGNQTETDAIIIIDSDDE